MINLIYLILLSLPLYLVKFNVAGIPTTALELEIYALAVCFLIFNAYKKNLLKSTESFLKNPFFVPFILFLVAGAISVFVLPDKRTALGIFKAYFFDAGLFFFLFVSLVKTKEQVKNSILAVVISALALSLIGLVQFFWFPQFLQEGRIKSVFSSPNYLSLYITPILFLAFGFWGGLDKLDLYKKFIFLFSYFLIFLILVLTFSRGAWLAFLVALVFYIALLLVKKFRKLRIAIIASFIVIAILSSLFIIKGAYVFKIIPDARVIMSDNVRVEVWKTSWEIGKKNWLAGVGLGNFQNYFNDYTKNNSDYVKYIQTHALTPHNIFLNIWLQTGLLGLLGFLGLLVMFFCCGYRGLKKNFLLSAVILTSMVAILVQGLFDSSIWKNDLMIYFWFLIGLCLVGQKNQAKGVKNEN